MIELLFYFKIFIELSNIFGDFSEIEALIIARDNLIH